MLMVMIKNSHLPVLIVYGPTAVGKTAFVEELIAQSRGFAWPHSFEVINGDMGQLYAPLAIGTAKPDLKNPQVPHHLFDVLEEPINFSAYDYRLRCARLIPEIMARGNVPIIVGGSGFYVRSLFFPPHASDDTDIRNHKSDQQGDQKRGSLTEDRPADNHHDGDGRQDGDHQAWHELFAVDPERARALHPHDMYRIERALALWKKTGTRPSQFLPQFDPIAQCKVIYLDRERDDLVERINRRVVEMFELGWIGEVASLPSVWCPFLKRKGLMGYGDICSALEANAYKKEELIATIQAKTRTYARRQRIFWRGLRSSLDRHGVEFSEFNLTFSSLDLYIKQVLNSLFS
jgi:tRNA dimethylallyltransferase